MKDKFRLSNGELSRYAFACGYIQTTTKGDIRTELYTDGACYHVRQFNDNTHERIRWDSLDSNSLTLARKHYRNLSKGETTCII